MCESSNSFTHGHPPRCQIAERWNISLFSRLVNKSSSPLHIKTNEGHYDTGELTQQPPRPPREREHCLILYLGEFILQR